MTPSVTIPRVPIRILDVLTVLVYLAAMAGIGVYFARKQRTTESYFVGNRAFPGWAVGLSMFATSISSVTFLAFPVAAYILDWRQVVQNLTLPLIAVLAIIFFIPFFRRGRATSAYEYLEERYGPVLRLYGAIIFILMQFLRLGMVLFLVAIPVQILTGLPIIYVILAVGLVVAFYTVTGGLEAVIWIDVVQALVLISGAVFPLIFIVIALPEGLSQIVRIGVENHKFGLGPMNWSLAERTFPVMILIGLLNWTTEYTTNQNVIQRYLAAASAREARKATAICAVMSVPIWLFFFFVGTSLFAFYHVFPDPVIDQMIATKQADYIFPYFILTKIPAGLAGLVVAGLLAATMALDSSINSVATITTVDIVKRHICRDRDDAFYLRSARIVSIVAAAVMIVGAILLSNVPKESMVDLGLSLAQIIFGSGLCGVFLIGFLTRRVHYGHAIFALILTFTFTTYLALSAYKVLPDGIRVPVHTYWIGVLANGFFMIVAYLTSLIVPTAGKPLRGLTVWTLERKLDETAPA